MKDINHNALVELVGKVFLLGIPETRLEPHARVLLEKHRVGNIILFGRNISSVSQTAQLNRDLNGLARQFGQESPLIIATDQENGMVRRLSADVPGFPGNMAVGATGDPGLAYEIGVMTGRWLALAGINLNLAPVLDVNNNPLNPVIGVRSYGDDPHAVAEMGTRMIQGLKQAGVLACAKHFPGHGDTQVDSHLDLPVIRHDRARVDTVELVPFKAAIAQSVPAIMTAHIVFEQIDPQNPATLSYRIVTEILRQELHYEGLVITDCMEMNAISRGVGVGGGAVKALLAGADMVTVSHRLHYQEEAIQAVLDAIEQGTLPISRLEEAAARVAVLKQNIPPSQEWQPTVVERTRREAEDLQIKVSRRALTRVTSQSKPFPSPRRVAVVMPRRALEMSASDLPIGDGYYVRTIHDILQTVELRAYNPDDINSSEDLMDADWVIWLIDARDYDEGKSLSRILECQPHGAVFLLSVPYNVTDIRAKHVYALYENTPWMIHAAIRALQGGDALGRLPVRGS